MKRVGLYLALLIFGILQSGCISRGSSDAVFYSDTLYSPSAAEGFDVFAYGKSSVVVMYDPWQGADGVRQEVFIARDGEAAPEGFDGIVLTPPLERVVCMSSSHVEFIKMLGCRDVIKGVSGARYLYDSSFREQGVRDVGYDAGTNFEAIAAIKPDVVFVYGVGGEGSVVSKLNEMGLKAVYIGEFNEPTPLGKAEWMVAFGEMFDLRERACVEFDSIRMRYDSLREAVREVRERPLVMFNSPWRDSWYVPGGNGYLISLLKDAAGAYVVEDIGGNMSRPISLEKAYIMASKADYWLNPGDARSLDDLAASNPKFADLEVVTSGRVYNNTRRRSLAGGSDFWESGTVRPDVILRDMIMILHPELMAGEQLYYFEKLN